MINIQILLGITLPGSPSLEGRKPGILSRQLVTYKGPEGSNPSPGAYLADTFDNLLRINKNYYP